MTRSWFLLVGALAITVGCSLPGQGQRNIAPAESMMARHHAGTSLQPGTPRLPFDATVQRESTLNHSQRHELRRPHEQSIQQANFDVPVASPVPETLQVVAGPVASTNTQPLRARTIEEALAPPATFEVGAAVRSPLPLDLTGALAMAVGDSPHIAFAAARYREAYARLQAAQVLWLPSLRAGISYNHHDGSLQASDGAVLNVSRSSLHTGLGTRAVGAGTPMIHGVSAEFHATDAVFQPKIAGHTANARNAAVGATRNDILLSTALAYTEVLRAMQHLKIAEETLGNAQSLAKLTDTFAQAGQGPQADADRTRTELVRRRNEVSRADERVRVAIVRLAELLSLDPSLEVMPQEATIVPIDLVSPELPATELVATGLSNRPELAEVNHLVCEAVYRYRREKYAPWLPSVLLGLSQSDFGGGFGSSIVNNDSRFDFDATVYWELRNIGFGERAKREETRSQYDQARAAKIAMMDRVAREVVESHVQVRSRQGQIAVAQSGVAAATQSYDRNVTRIREGQGLPIEALQSMQALDEARREYLRTITDYNVAQFRLQRALGWPIR